MCHNKHTTPGNLLIHRAPLDYNNVRTLRFKFAITPYYTPLHICIYTTPVPICNTTKLVHICLLYAPKSYFVKYFS